MPRVLIIEDNEDNRDALSRRLMRRGYDVIAATNGQDGVQMAENERPDIVLMDMNMPILDGWEATRLLRSNEATTKLPIIGLTAHAMAGDREKAIDAGCADYHTKPIDYSRLLDQIETLLSSKDERSERDI